LITKYMLDAGAHIRARRIGGPLRLTEFAIAIGLAKFPQRGAPGIRMAGG
jgi:hypothetical protein